jgi:hypothetical protein
MKGGNDICATRLSALSVHINQQIHGTNFRRRGSNRANCARAFRRRARLTAASNEQPSIENIMATFAEARSYP